MRALPWFHLYHEARTDRKLATLSDREFRLWFNLLCYAAEQDERGTIPPTDEYLLAIEIGANGVEEIDRLIGRLVALRIVSRDVTECHDDVTSDEPICHVGVTFTNFKDRNSISPSDLPDATRERKQRQRDREKQAQIEVGHEDVTTVTPLDKKRVEKSRREEIRKEENGSLSLASPNGAKPHNAEINYSNDFLTFWNQYPTGHGSKKVAFEVWQRLKPDGDLRLDILASLARWNASEQWQQGYIKDAERFLRNRMWEVEPPPPKPLAPTRNKAQEQVDMLKRIAMEAQS
jgi:hypothetical protein